jgi:hypothetical protein
MVVRHGRPVKLLQSSYRHLSINASEESYAYSGQSRYQTTCEQKPTKSELIWKFGIRSGDGWVIHFVNCPMKYHD